MANVVVFDASFLLPIFSRNLHSVPEDPETGKPVEQYDKRIDYLLNQLRRRRVKMLIPAPALSEILVRVEPEQIDGYLKEIFSKSAFRIAFFNRDAAIEVAIMSREAKKQGDKRGGSTEVWNKVKFDRQIIAIAKVNGAKIIYSNDKKLGNFAKHTGLRIIRPHELEFQRQLSF